MSSSSTWYPGIQQACTHWKDAPMLQQTYQAFQETFEHDNDAVIDAAKALVEVVCNIIIDEFHTVNEPFRPEQREPTIGNWLHCAVKALKLGDVRDEQFKGMVSAHHELAKTLNLLRNKAGPVSHGKEGYLERLSDHHRRSAVLAADAIVAFLFEAFTESHINLELTREPYERFTHWNTLIDQNVAVETLVDEDDGMVNLLFRVPSGDEIPLKVDPSRLLYQLDRQAYILAKNAAVSVLPTIKWESDQTGETWSLSYFPNDLNQYRYHLAMDCADLPTIIRSPREKTPKFILFILTNPSIAGKAENNYEPDETVKKLVRIVEKLNSLNPQSDPIARFEIANVYPLIEQDASKLQHYDEQKLLGDSEQANDWVIERARQAEKIFVGWGAEKVVWQRGQDILSMLDEANLIAKTSFVRGNVKKGTPYHPRRWAYEDLKQLQQAVILLGKKG